MHHFAPKSHEAEPIARSILSFTTRTALIFCAAFMISWFVFLVCGIIYFELILD